MKSFDDFLASLSSKDQEEIMKKSMSLITGESFSENEIRLAARIAPVAGMFTRELLRKYHEWLAGQM